MPSETERASIASRLARLESELEPATAEQIIEIARDLFSSAPQQNVAPEVMRNRYRVFVEALNDLPWWAIRAAAVNWIKGKAKGSVTFAPSSGDLRRMAESEILPHRALIERLRRVLTAKPLAISEREADPESRQRIATKMGEFLGTFEGKIRDEKTRAAQYQDETAKKVRA